MDIGVLALQGAVREHINMLERIGARGRAVKKVKELDGVEGLIIPGGESTTISKLMAAYDLMEKVGALARKGLPLFGTCAGMIMMAEREGELIPVPAAQDFLF